MPKKTPKLTDYPASLQTPTRKDSSEPSGWCNTAAMLSSLLIITLIVLFIIGIVWYWNKPKTKEVDVNVKQVRFAEGNTGTVKECSESDYAQISSPTSGKDALVVFVADWCGYCKKMKPEIQEAVKMCKIPIYQIEFDENQPWMREAMKNHGIEGFPALVLFRQGQPPKLASGYRPKEEILRFIES